MIKQRPAGVLTFAILCFIFGGLGLACGSCGAILVGSRFAILKAVQAQQQPGVQTLDVEKYLKDVEAHAPGLMAVKWAQITIRLVLSLGLVVAGICLLKMSSFGRWACVAIGVVFILAELGGVAYGLAVEAPAVDEANRLQGAVAQGGASMAGAVCAPAIIIIFCSAMVIYMLLPATGHAFANADDSRRSEQDYYDPDFRRDRRDLPES